MRRSSALRTIIVALAIAAAFAAGLLVASIGGREQPAVHSVASEPSGIGRDVYSPRLRTDPHFLAAQKRNVESLEKLCTDSGQYCAEARAARSAYDQLRSAR